MNPIIQQFQAVGPLKEQACIDFNNIIGCQQLPKNTVLLEIGKKPCNYSLFIKV